jgi:glycosyltransferase involved in cell wall biosynthesis
MSELRRVAVDARYLNDRYHGIGRFGFRLLEALVETAPQVTFVLFRGRAADGRFDWAALASRPNVETRPGPWPLYWPHEQLLWPGLLRRARADLFYSPYFVAPLLAAVPATITIHDLIFERYPEYMPQAWARPYYRQLMGRSLARASRVIVPSQATAADLRQIYRVPPAKIAVIPEAAEPAFRPLLDPEPLADLRRRYDLGRPFILAVGARRPHKNFGRLVTAFARIAGQVEHDLVLVGPADDRFPDEARLAAEAGGVRERVRFLGWVPEADLPGLYSLAEVAAVPSLIEGFGLPALEAMACGTPVLAGRASSLPEVVGQAGLLVDPTSVDELSQGLWRLLSQPELRQELGQAGLRQAGQFSWARAARQALALDVRRPEAAG